MGTAVKARSAGKQPVSVTDLHHIIFRRPCCSESSCAALLPQVHVVLGIESHNSSSCRSAGGVDPDTVRKRCSHQPVGVLVSEVVFAECRKQVKVLDPVDMLRADAQLVHLLFIVRDIVVNSLDLFDQSFVLPCCDLFPGGAFHLRVKIVLHVLLLSSFINVLMRA